MVTRQPAASIVSKNATLVSRNGSDSSTVPPGARFDCALDGIRAHLAKTGSNTTAPKAPTLATVMGGGSPNTQASNDCAAVGRHLAELEGDTTHGPDHRPDPATCDKCAAHYTNECETQAWSDERRSCTLAAADLINAHLCAGGVRPTPDKSPTNVPPNLACKPLSQHLAAIAQSAGMHSDVADFPQQIEAACDLGSWSLELRQCFAGATTLSALEACIMPSDAS